MNLLTDKWIPVRQGGQFEKITLQQLLTTDAAYQLALPRDDMELGALQLLISLVQAIATPDDAERLRHRANTPLTKDEYLQLCDGWLDKFDLLHETQPFMQVIDPKAKEATPIQKLFVGLPVGTTAHTFFNDSDEVEEVCGGCAAIAMYNVASNAPGFSSKYLAGLRGGAKINTFAMGDNLRKSLWANILIATTISRILPESKKNNFCWADLVKPGEKIHAGDIGINRGLFWQPLRLKLQCKNSDIVCQSCGHESDLSICGFINEPLFKFEVIGKWPHPHSPRKWNIEQGIKDEKYLSPIQAEPTWTQLNHFIVNKVTSGDGDGWARSANIDQYENVFFNDDLRMLVSSYTCKPANAKIYDRKHELYAFSESWPEKNRNLLLARIEDALKIRSCLSSALWLFYKNLYDKKDEKAKLPKNHGKQVQRVQKSTSLEFYHLSEPVVHGLLRSFKRTDKKAISEEFNESIKRISRQLFEQATSNLSHSPEGFKSYLLAKSRLENSLKEIIV